LLSALPTVLRRRPDDVDRDPALAGHFHHVARAAVPVRTFAVPDRDEGLDTGQHRVRGHHVRVAVGGLERQHVHPGGFPEEPFELSAVGRLHLAFLVVGGREDNLDLPADLEHNLREHLVGAARQAGRSGSPT
jgi:hypothetical protein